MSYHQYTEKVSGKRQWKQTIYLAEMFDRYLRCERDSHDFFVGVLKRELGLKEGDFTSYVGVYRSSYSYSLVVGGKVSIFPFEEYNWVVKCGVFEVVVENMEGIFDIIRRAWEYYD